VVALVHHDNIDRDVLQVACGSKSADPPAHDHDFGGHDRRATLVSNTRLLR
jgi:hypothetical protein